MSSRSPSKEILNAHKFSSNHRRLIELSTKCACFYCRKTFNPSEIKEWIDRKQTALCPACSVDSVLPSAAPIPFTNGFIRMMSEYWFSNSFDIGDIK